MTLQKEKKRTAQSCAHESADEFAENIKNLAQRAYPSADQNMLDNLVVERFRKGTRKRGVEKTPMPIPLNRTTGLDRRVRAI